MSPITELIGGAKAYGWGSFSAIPESFESIATAYPGNNQSVTFSSIPQTFAHLQLRCSVRGNDAGTIDTWFLRLNGLAPSAGYRGHFLRGVSTSISAFTTADNYMNLGNPGGQGNDFNVLGAFIVDILDYTNTNKYKTLRNIGGFETNSIGRTFLTSGFLTTTTNAITQIDLSGLSGGFMDRTTIALYGIKAAA